MPFSLPYTRPVLRLLLFLGAFAVLISCETEDRSTLLYGKDCELGNCARGFSCHPSAQRCVSDADAMRLRAEGNWFEEGPTDHPTPSSGGSDATPGQGASGGGGSDPAAPIENPSDAAVGGAPALDAGAGGGASIGTGALPERTLGCGSTNPSTCGGDEVCCAEYGRRDSCILPGEPCDCSSGCDILRCSKQDDCFDGQICCFERDSNPGGTRCTTAADCGGVVMCDPDEEDCDDECTHDRLVRQECTGQSSFVP